MIIIIDELNSMAKIKEKKAVALNHFCFVYFWTIFVFVCGS